MEGARQAEVAATKKAEWQEQEEFDREVAIALDGNERLDMKQRDREMAKEFDATVTASLEHVEEIDQSANPLLLPR